MQVELLGEGQLKMVAGDGLVERGRGQGEACPQAWIGRVEVEGAVAVAVGGRRRVVGHTAGGDGDGVAFGSREAAEPSRRLQPGPIEQCVHLVDDLVFRRVLKVRVGAQPVPHQRRVIEAELGAGDLSILVVEANQLGAAELVDGVGSV